MKAAMGSKSSISLAKSRKSLTSTAHDSTQGGPKSIKNSKEAKNNDWIPTQAVRAILSIRD